MKTTLVVSSIFAGVNLLLAADPLSSGFATPPRESRPETWFHLIGGNVARPGLTADLEAVADAGLSGIQLFHGQFGGPWPGVTPQIACLSPSWDGMISHTADDCRRLGLSFTMQNCPGWAMSGGPWIKPENSMRDLIFSRTDVVGGNQVSIHLPKPQPSAEDWRDYRDIAVLAFPTPAGDDGTNLVPSAVRGSNEKLPWADLLHGAKGVSIQLAPAANHAWVEVSFATPVTLRSLELPSVEKLARRRNFDPGAAIRVEAVGPNGLVPIARREIPRSNWQDDQPLVLALPDATASTFRFTFENKTALELSSFRLSSAARVDDWHGQAGYVLRSLNRSPPPPQDEASWIAPARVVDLSKHMDSGGKLEWTALAGKWTVVRFGHVNTGARNAPAPKEATGFECDKLSKKGADVHFAGYIGRISAAGGPADAGRLNGMVIDSWECHTQTWTPEMEREFAGLRGYALRPWLPALAGWVIGDHLTSRRFLRDWRATLNDLLVSNYYGRLATLGRERGLKLSFESGPGDVPTGDILQYYGKADIPMCELWHPNDPHWGGLESKPILPAVSAAHIYGKKQVAAEAFTNIDIKWNEHPFMLKHLADRHFAQGLNHLVFHTYTHNPRLDVVPGTSFGAQIGTPFIRGQTWWPHMPEWTRYLSRCQFMLQQGRPVADVLWYLGDDLDHKPRQEQVFPEGIKFDYLNPDVLIHRISVADGVLKSPEGVTWKALWLPGGTRLTLPSLARLHGLVQQGAIVIGLPAFENPSLSGGAADELKFKQIVRKLWGETIAATGDRKLGKGRLLWGDPLASLLEKAGVQPDVTGAGAATWCHRRTDNAEIYFVAADRRFPLNANLRFASQGVPELWNPLLGTGRPADFHQIAGNGTTVHISLPAAGSVFVIFRKEKSNPGFVRMDRDGKTLVDLTDPQRVDKHPPQATQGLKSGEPVQPLVESPPLTAEILDGGQRLLAWQAGDYQLRRGDQFVAKVTVEPLPAVPLTGPWKLSFPPGWDAPERIDLPQLKPWSDLEDPAARAFSGSATYTCEVNLDAPAADTRYLLDLGHVSVIAEVVVNGKLAATLWGPPFRADITTHLTGGANVISIKVTNTWFNRLAYDASLPPDRRKTWTIRAPAATAPLETSGLAGPVVLRSGRLVELPR
ncbi:glycosyl hydrolase [Luteolibacter arcticus]|uniref:Glycosyl hydrolase n=1 Tax=Luteolibacter arcticus TaxID=1581411 RepID=A0ABT3GQC5_9BACT|nr:glycosyl hydrolase [Luteolibacter arcticus]